MWSGFHRKQVPHDVRVKLSAVPKVQSSELISVAIQPEVRVAGAGRINEQDLTILKHWTELNRDVIIRFWNGEIEYTEDAIAALIAI